MSFFTLKQIPEEERPRERLQKLGEHSLTAVELMAIILGNGIKGKSALHLASEMFFHFGGLVGIANATIEELCQIKGLGVAKAIKLKAAFGLALKIPHETKEKIIKIQKPQDVFHLLKSEFKELEKEYLIALMLNVQNRVLAFETISIGTLTEVLIHPREIFYPAIRHKAASLVIAHNHPSGDVSPSQQDIQVTQKLISAGKIIGIPIWDHLIFGKDTYFSFKQQALLNFN